MKPSRCLHEAFTQWARRGASAKGLRRLHERFMKTSRAPKASAIPTEASWSLLEGFARRSWRLHLEKIREIMTSPQHVTDLCLHIYTCTLLVRYLYHTTVCTTNSERGKREAQINWSMVTAKAAPVTGTIFLRTTGPAVPPVDSRQ